MIICPNCGHQQMSGTKCDACTTIFAYHTSPTARRLTPVVGALPDKPARSTWRTIYQVSSWLALAVLIAAIVLVLHKSPPPALKPDPEAAARLQGKLNSPPPPTGEGAPEPLRLDEAELNSYLLQNLALQPLVSGDTSIAEVQSSVKDIQIALEGDMVKTYVLFDFHGMDLSLLLDGRIHVEDGYLRFEPVSGLLGSLPLSEFTLNQAVKKLMSSPLNKEKFRVPSEIKDIRVENSELVVTYR